MLGIVRTGMLEGSDSNAALQKHLLHPFFCQVVGVKNEVGGGLPLFKSSGNGSAVVSAAF
jgi:hypothetical protein